MRQIQRPRPRVRNPEHAPNGRDYRDCRDYRDYLDLRTPSGRRLPY